jgi:hypothetical protein
MECFARGWRGRSFFHRSNTRSAEEKIYPFSLVGGWVVSDLFWFVLCWAVLVGGLRGRTFIHRSNTRSAEKLSYPFSLFGVWVVLDCCVYPVSLGRDNEKVDRSMVSVIEDFCDKKVLIFL